MGLSSLKNVRISNILAKATGLVGLGLIGYDAHVNGQLKAVRYEKDVKSGELVDLYMDSRKLGSSSAVESKVKKGIFRFSTNEHISDIVRKPKGYISGFFTTIADKILPFGLVVGTMFGKLSSKSAASVISKFSAIGLAAYGAGYVIKQAFGLGKEY